MFYTSGYPMCAPAKLQQLPTLQRPSPFPSSSGPAARVSPSTLQPPPLHRPPTPLTRQASVAFVSAHPDDIEALAAATIEGTPP
jgi:hypothetical protein